MKQNKGEKKMGKKIPPCPKCKGKNIAKFVYGLPADRDWYIKAKKDKKIVGGGCTRTINEPNWKCNDCWHEWNDDKKLKKLLLQNLKKRQLLFKKLKKKFSYTLKKNHQSLKRKLINYVE